MGRHNTICVMIYFASIHFPDPEPSHDIVFRRCQIDNVDRFLIYNPADLIQRGTNLAEVILEDVTFTDLNEPSIVCAPEEAPLTVRMTNVTASFREGAVSDAGVFDGADPNTHILA